MAFAKFYIGNPMSRTLDPKLQIPDNIHSIEIRESDSFNGVYTTIDTVRIPTAERGGYIETWNASEEWFHKWYQIQFISDPAVDPVTKYATSEPIVPESTAEIVDSIRDWLGDTDLNAPAWSDIEYIQSIRFALRQLKGERNAGNIQEWDIVPLQLLVREIYANAIAYDHARYYQLQAPAATLDKSQIMAHYLQVAADCRAQYDAYSKRLNMESGGYNDDQVISQMPAPNVVNMKRFSRNTGLEVNSIGPTKSRRRQWLFSANVSAAP